MPQIFERMRCPCMMASDSVCVCMLSISRHDVNCLVCGLAVLLYGHINDVVPKSTRRT